MDNAITLKPVTDPIFEYGKSAFQKASESLTDETMRNLGVQDSKLVKSLGLFGIAFFALVSLIALYFLLKLGSSRSEFLLRTKNILEMKLFYGFPYRYMVVSYLKMAYTVFAFLLSSVSNSNSITIAYMIIITVLICWPVYILLFMSKYKT